MTGGGGGGGGGSSSSSSSSSFSYTAQCIVIGPVCLCVCLFVAGGRCPNLTTVSARAVFASL